MSDIISILKCTYKRFDEDLFHSYCQRFDISLDKKTRTFSTGMKAKLNIIIALTHHAKLLILDEPTAGLVFNSFSYDMYHNEMTYLFALPFSKKEYCIEKYIYAFTVTFISWLIAFLISSATHINLETIIVQLAMLFSAFIYISITIPVMMKYGREKATIIVLMLMLVLFLAAASGATSVGMLMSQISAFLLIGIYAFIVLIVLIISYRSTISILNDKEL